MGSTADKNKNEESKENNVEPEELEEIIERKVQERVEEELEKRKEEDESVETEVDIKQTGVDEEEEDGSISRRSFLKRLGAGVAGVGALSMIPSASALDVKSDGLSFYGGSGSGLDFDVDNSGNVTVYNDISDNGTTIWDSSAGKIGDSVVDTGALDFDTATQTELDNHAGTSSAHHSKYTDSEAVSAIESNSLTGPLDFDESTGEKLNLYGTSYGLGVDSSTLALYSNRYVRFRGDGYSNATDIEMDLDGPSMSINGNTVWHAGNDGDGSGLDADTVDGSEASDLGGPSTLGNVANHGSDVDSSSPGGTYGEGIAFAKGGDKLYRLDSYDQNSNGNATLYEYDLSTSWDAGSASLINTYDISQHDSNGRGLGVSDNGNYIYFAGTGNGKIYQLSLSTAYDISTASLNNSISDTDIDGYGVAIAGDGAWLYGTDSAGDKITSFKMSTAHDLGTATKQDTSSVSVNADSYQPHRIWVSNDGRRLVLGDDGNYSNPDVHYQLMGSKHDLTTRTSGTAVSITPSSDDEIGGIHADLSSEQLFLITRLNNNIHRLMV